LIRKFCIFTFQILNFHAMKKTLLFLSVCLYSVWNYSQNVSAVQFATGFSAALAIEHPANDSRLFVVQQGGLIRIVNSNGTVNATPFLNLTSLTTGSGERGLLGLAFHPNYATNGWFFVNYTNLSGHTVIARYSVSSDPNVADPTGLMLMTINQPASNHNGGSLRFGPDGYLYIGMGDGGGGGDTSGYAQNLDTAYPAIAGNPSRIYLGKMLRLDVNNPGIGILNYGIPPTNPFVGQSGKEEIWAYGLRNPWKFSFNRLNGDLWIADVGQGSVEEIDRIASPLPNTGLNFGWRCFEGSAPYSSSIGTCPAYAATVAPFTEYSSATGSRCSITGGYYYTGSAYPNFNSKYFFADYCTGEVAYANAAGTITWAYDSPGSITSLGEDMNGELYFTTGSIVYRIVDTLSTTEFANSGFSLYPNPSSDTVFIKSTTDVLAATIELFDISGKLLLSKKGAATSENSISVSDFAKGVYILAVQTVDGNRYNTRLVVQ
jgi:glucose/arabinose dehydrogenase